MASPHQFGFQIAPLVAGIGIAMQLRRPWSDGSMALLLDPGSGGGPA